GKSHRSRVPHFSAGGIEDLRQALAAPFGWRRHCIPAGQTPSAVSFFPAGRRGHVAIGKARTVSVADPIERGDDFAGKAASFRDDRIDVVDAELAEQALLYRGRECGGVFERRADVGKRSAIAHLRSPTDTPGGGAISAGTKKSDANCRAGSTR